MKRIIINGDPGLRKDGIIEVEGEEFVCFQVIRNGDFHGPDKVQLWCVGGDESEREDYNRRNFIPHFLDVIRAEEEDVAVKKAKGDPATA